MECRRLGAPAAMHCAYYRAGVPLFRVSCIECPCPGAASRGRDSNPRPSGRGVHADVAGAAAGVVVGRVVAARGAGVARGSGGVGCAAVRSGVVVAAGGALAARVPGDGPAGDRSLPQDRDSGEQTARTEDDLDRQLWERAKDIRVSRKDFIRASTVSAVAVAAPSVLAACGGSSESRSSTASGCGKHVRGGTSTPVWPAGPARTPSRTLCRQLARLRAPGPARQRPRRVPG